MDHDYTNQMALDSSDDYVIEPPDVETDDVAVITPETIHEKEIRADDETAIKEFVLDSHPLVEQPPLLDEQSHTWNITGWRSLQKKEHGPVFTAGGYPWRILMFPYGNNVDFCSFYLEQGFPEGEVPEDWSCCIQFSLVLWNKTDPTIHTHHTAHHRFTKDEGDWGFTRFYEIRKLFQPGGCGEGKERPLVEEDSANITAFVRVVKDETGVLWHSFVNYDSKKETGFVGLKNQGATCYLNSLIQSLYFTNAFRKAVYAIPTQDEENLTNSAYTLQRLFYQLQTSTQAVSTNELTKSFGWEARHIFEQQDVQELSRKLMERMEEKMKGTKVQHVLPELFRGKLKTYISCINVPYESSRVEDFWDLQLNVRGNSDVAASFKDYISVEKMDGENQYFAGDEYKLQDANKGVIFESFPEVMHLQLKRFEYDFMRDAMTKVNDRYEFPEIIDLAPFLSKDAEMSEPWTYQLHGVLVHSGDLNAGHYYAFLKPTKDGCFYKYDDDKVTRATMREVLEENYGGEYIAPNGIYKPNSKPMQRVNSAYMLVYIRQSRLDHVLCPVGQEDTPSHLQRRLEEEAAIKEARRREREEQHLYLGVRVITEQTFQAHHGTDLTLFDVAPDTEPGAAKYYRLRRTATIQDLIDQIGHDTKRDPKRIRLWCMVNRQNKTIRPDAPITDHRKTIEDTHGKMAGGRNNDLRVWAEVAEEVNEAGEPIWPGSGPNALAYGPKNDNILLFLKCFDVEAQQLFGIGHIYVSKEKKVEELTTPILAKIGLTPADKVQLKLWEEIKPSMIEPMKAKQSLKAAELQDGDIVCFQKVVDPKLDRKLAFDGGKSDLSIDSKSSSDKTCVSPTISSTRDRIEDAREWYDYLTVRRVVHFAPHPRLGSPGQEAVDVELSTRFTYDQVAERVGERLGVDSTHLRFYTVNLQTGNPKVAVKRNPTQTLQQILSPPYASYSGGNQRQDSLYYEVLDISLTELDTKKSLKVVWLTEGISKEEQFEVLVPKNGDVSDVIAALIKRAKLDDINPDHIRVYEVHNYKLYKELPPDYSVVSITDYVNLVAEKKTEEELNDPDNSHYVYAFHFQTEPSKAHGIPFRFLIRPEEKFSETKKRLEKRTGFKGKNFEKIKFAVVKKGPAYSKPTYLTDDDIIWEIFGDEDLLGLDHLDRARAARNGAGDLFLK